MADAEIKAKKDAQAARDEQEGAQSPVPADILQAQEDEDVIF